MASYEWIEVTDISQYGALSTPGSIARLTRLSHPPLLDRACGSAADL
jgi:hypothetical protein